MVWLGRCCSFFVSLSSLFVCLICSSKSGLVIPGEHSVIGLASYAQSSAFSVSSAY